MKQFNVDTQLIIDTVINMPLEGNNEGLIPAFNVYLAHTPQDFYNLISIKFIKEMEKIGLHEVAKDMLTEDAEHCALNTFGGMLESDEWAALILPMIKDDSDVMAGLISVANALGWGRINIKSLVPNEEMVLTSSNGYEAYGYIELEKYGHTPQCFMLKGISAGLMELLYRKGDFEDRVGEFESEETTCIPKRDSTCTFIAKATE